MTTGKWWSMQTLGVQAQQLFHYCVTLSSLLSFCFLVSCLDKRRHHHSICPSCSFVRIQWVVLCWDGLSRSDVSDFLQQPGSSIHGDSPSKNNGIGSMPSSRGSSQPRGPTQVSRIAGGFFTIWVKREAHGYWEWVAYPFSRGSSWPGNRTGVSCIAGRFFTSSALKEAHLMS